MRCTAAFSGAYGDARVSPQRQAIVAAVAALPGAFTIDELTAAMRKRRVKAGVATLYRAVAALEASGWLERVGERNGSALFARCSGGRCHHHHVVCGGCGRVAAVGCPVLEGAKKLVELGGFVITRHELTLHGLCAKCRSSRNAEALVQDVPHPHS